MTDVHSQVAEHRKVRLHEAEERQLIVDRLSNDPAPPAPPPEPGPSSTTGDHSSQGILRRWWKRSVVLTVPGALLILLALVVVPERQLASHCPATTDPSARDAVATSAAIAPAIAATDLGGTSQTDTGSPEVAIGFGRRPGALSTSIVLGPRTGEAVPTASVVGAVARGETGTVAIPPAQVVVAVGGTSTVAQLDVCVDRDGLEPGTYKGQIAVVTPSTDTGVDPVVQYVPLTVTMANSSWVAPVLIWAIVLALGVSYAIFAGVSEKLQDTDSLLVESLHEKCWKWLTSVRGVLAVLVGLGAAMSVFFAKYLGAATWGAGGVSEYLALTGTMLATMTTGGSLIRTFGRSGRSDSTTVTEAKPA